MQAQLDLIEGGIRESSDRGVSPSAVIAGEIQNSVIGRNVVIERGASIQRSVLLDGAYVRENALISDSIVGFGAEIGQSSIIESFSIVGHDAEVPAETKINTGKWEK